MEKVIVYLINKYGDINIFFNKIAKNLLIRVACYSKKIGGKKVLIPYLVKSKKSIYYSVKLIIKSINMRSEYNLHDRIKNELIDVYTNKGFSIQQRLNIIKMVESNYVNSRYSGKKKKK